MDDVNDDQPSGRATAESKQLLRKLQRSIRSSIAASSRRDDWDPDDLVGHAAAFGETLQWRHEELNFDIGVNRTIAAAELEAELRPLVRPYVTYFNAYLTIAEHVNTAAGHRWRTSNRARLKINVMCEFHAQALTIAEEVITS